MDAIEALGKWKCEVGANQRELCVAAIYGVSRESWVVA